jgi:hypothetical protein
MNFHTVENMRRALSCSLAKERGITRRNVIRLGAGAAGLTLPALRQAYAKRPNAEILPKPIPGGINIAPFGFFHLFLPGPGLEPSSITDFNGNVGIALIRGEGTGTTAGISERLTYEVDIRFMTGLYRGLDGRNHEGTFGFF